MQGVPVNSGLHPRDTLRATVLGERVKQRFPSVGALDFDVTAGAGPGYAEFYPQGESMSPDPTRNLVELRRMDLPDEELEAVVLGDALHLMAKANPKFRSLKQEFLESVQAPQMEVMREMYERNKTRNPRDRRTFEEFVDQSAADAFIRDYVFQKYGTIPGGKPFVSGLGPIMGGFFPENMKSLRGIGRLVGVE